MAIMEWLQFLILKITPTKLNDYIQLKVKAYRLKKQKLKAKIKAKTPKGGGFLPKLLTTAKILKEKITAIITQTLDFIKGIQPKQDFSKLTNYFNEKLKHIAIKLKDKYSALKPKTIWISLGIIVLVTIASLQFYVSAQKIYEETKEEEIVEVIKEEKKPIYYKKMLKQFQVMDLKMPIYVESAATVKSLTMDLTMESSNRYIKHFFDKNYHYIQDQLNSGIEPIVPTFPLENEGKEIIKEKLKMETNDLLKKLKIEGTIQEVYFHSIMAS